MERVNAAMEFTGRERPTPPGRLQKADLPKWQPEEEVTLDLSTILLPKLDSLEHGGWAGSSRRRWQDSEVQRYNILRDWPAWLGGSPKFCSEFQKKAVCAEVTQGAHFPHLSEEEKLNRIVLLG